MYYLILILNYPKVKNTKTQKHKPIIKIYYDT